ncbi:MAG: S8 family peptidase [Lachnospiraceae bacterium]
MSPCTSNVASEEYADFIFQYNYAPPETVFERVGTNCVDFINRDYAVVYPLLKDSLPLSLEKYAYASIPKLYALLDTTSMEASGIIRSFGQPSLNLRGKGTVIGFIDTGIDYRNPLFQNQDNTSRILGIWDQTLPADGGDSSNRGIQTELTSTTFLYGQEFVKEQIDLALASEDPLAIVPSTDTNGHGTFLAGIAAGGEAAEVDFIGAAPDCMLGIVKLKPAKQYLRDFYCLGDQAEAYQENDIMLGIKYLLGLAARHQMPLVILLGLGTNLGSHTGSSPLGQYLRALSNSLGLAVVVAGGNETGFHHHFYGNIASGNEFEDAEIRVAEGEAGFTAELWAQSPELYTIGFISPSGEQIPRVPVVLGQESRITFLLEPTVITVNYQNAEVGSGSQLIMMRFQNPSAGIWRIRVYNTLFISGQFHIWLPVRGFISDDTIFLKSNPNTTITEPGNAFAAITTAGYDHESGGIYIHSSRGFARDGRIKPELAAPGVDVYGPGLAPSAGDPSQLYMVRRTGTSVAAAHVAGAAANLMTWALRNDPAAGISDVSIRSYLIRGANRNPVYTYPNREWGYGTLDLYQSFLRMRE